MGLQNQLNVLARASAKIGLKVNLDKTKVMVFRNGGHLAVHEKRFIHGQRLEVVGSYVYLGYTLTTKLSVSNALEPIMVKAKKKVMNILRKIKCTDIRIFLRLFDQQVQATLIYAAELWTAKKIKEIEKVHMSVCKKALSGGGGGGIAVSKREGEVGGRGGGL